MKRISFLNKLSSTAGTTAVGKVEALGPETIGFKVGDSVLITTPGCWTDSMTLPIDLVHHIPSISSEEAALIPSLASAWAILNNYSSLSPGDTVLQMNGHNSIGIAINEVGKALGYIVLNCTSADVNSKDLRSKTKGNSFINMLLNPYDAA